MKLPRKKPVAPVGRRRLQSEDIAKPARVFSYHKQRSEQADNTGRNVQREAITAQGKRFGRFWLQRLGILILIVSVALSLLNMATLSTRAKIVTPTGTAASMLQDSAVYEAAINTLLNGSTSNRTKLTIDTSTISDKFVKQFPEVASASLVLPLFAHRPVLYIEPAEPALILAAHNGSFVVDTTGKVLIATTQLPVGNKLTLPVVTDQSSFTAKIGAQALSLQAVQNIRAIIGQLSAKNVTLSSLTLPPSSSELDATVSDQPYQVKFNLQTANARQQAGSFLATQAELKRTNVVPVQYIDVRVDGRAYYK